MKSILICSFLFLQFFCSCADNKQKEETAPASENDVDAARNFINAVLKSDFKKAQTFIINDSLNNQYLDATQRSFKEQLSDEDRYQYRNASINIHSIKPVNDSVSLISYSNSYKKKNERLKVVNRDGQWLVDLKYTFSPAAKDSMP
ncbi:MAG: hypothetical protein ABIN57_09815 [Chitinophagaceae bacterium]